MINLNEWVNFVGERSICDCAWRRRQQQQQQRRRRWEEEEEEEGIINKIKNERERVKERTIPDAMIIRQNLLMVSIFATGPLLALVANRDHYQAQTVGCLLVGTIELSPPGRERAPQAD